MFKRSDLSTSPPEPLPVKAPLAMLAESARIITRSRTQAMDWSLVLASQDIEHSIDFSPEEGFWFLSLAAAEEERARAAIRQYRWENRTGWRQPLPLTDLLFDIRSVFWFLVPIVLFLVDEATHRSLSEAGRMDNVAASHGQWWRLFTAVTLHADIAHLVANVGIGILFLGLAMGIWGTGTAWLASFLAGVGGNVAGWIVYHQPYHGLGASGMVMGALGLLVAPSVQFLRTHTKTRMALGRGFMAGVLLLVLLGFSPGTDIVAHLAGFGWGALFGFLLTLLPQKLLQRPAVNRVAELVCAALVILTWWLALR